MDSKPTAAPQRSIGFITVLLIALILSVQYIVAWYGLEMVKISKENDLNRHLNDLGQVAQPLLADATAEITDIAERAVPPMRIRGAAAPGEEARVSASEYAAQIGPGLRAPFNELAQRARLKGLTLLDAAGRVLLSTSDPDRVLVPFEFLEIDRDHFERALYGRTAESLAYALDSSPVKRVYVPLFDVDRHSVEAVLCLTAGKDYLATVGRLARRMRILSAISTVLVLFIGYIIYRLLVRQHAYEQRAAHADRLSSLGSLAAGFAHEVRNPLEIMAASAEELERALTHAPALAPETLESCRDILEEVERLDRLVDQFLEYSRADRPRGGSASIDECIGSAVAMLRRTAEKRGISILWRGASEAGAQVALDEGALRQIVVNLVLNAIQSTPDDGRIEIVTEGDLRRFRLSVSDTGPGVPAALRSRIFDPFFTTREGGSGLGLTIAHQLASGAGGRLWCEERPAGSGACFILELPRAAQSQAAAVAVAQVAAR